MSSEASPSAIPGPGFSPRPVTETRPPPPSPAGPGASRGPDLTRLRIDRAAARPRGRNGLLVALLLGALGFVGWAFATGRLNLSKESGAVEVTTTTVLPPGSSAGGGPAAAVAGEVTGNGYVIARRRAALSTVLSG